MSGAFSVLRSFIYIFLPNSPSSPQSKGVLTFILKMRKLKLRGLGGEGEAAQSLSTPPCLTLHPIPYRQWLPRGLLLKKFYMYMQYSSFFGV